MTPLIGITTYHRDERGYIQLPVQYAESVRRAGAIPLLLQPGEPRIEEVLRLIDGLILSGGGDVDPALYTAAQHEQVYWVNQERDAFEIDLAKRTLADEMPLFCICRGMQILNVALGGSLIPHIPDAVPDAIAHRQEPRDPVTHEIAVEPQSRLAQIMGGATVRTASWHHQSIDRVAADLTIVGRAPDGVIEAVEFSDRPAVMAVQWHPELTAHEDASQQNLFDELVRLAAARRKAKSG